MRSGRPERALVGPLAVPLATPRLAVMVIAAVALAACDTIPMPFRHEGTPPELARPQEFRAVAVRPIDDGPGAKLLATSVIKAFTKREIPASLTYDGPGDMTLDSWLDRSGGLVSIEWRLRGADHRPRASYRQLLPVNDWQSASPTEIEAFAEQAVAALTGQPGDAPAAPPVPSQPHRTTVHIKPLSGLPGDGNEALGHALKGALERSGLLVVGEGGDYIVEGQIGITADGPGQDMLSVAWVVSRPDGKKLGTVNQQGPVAKGTLDGPWGSLAHDIADGSAEGVVKVVEADHGGAPPLQNR